MSVTFYLGSTETLHAPCVECGIRAFGPLDPKSECTVCFGYGGESVRNGPELNVTNRNFYIVMRDLLGLPEFTTLHNDLSGELNPDDILAGLIGAEGCEEGIVRDYKPHRVSNVVEFGVTADQIRHYIVTLRKISTIAKRRGEPVLYG